MPSNISSDVSHCFIFFLLNMMPKHSGVCGCNILNRNKSPSLVPTVIFQRNHSALEGATTVEDIIVTALKKRNGTFCFTKLIQEHLGHIWSEAEEFRHFVVLSGNILRFFVQFSHYDRCGRLNRLSELYEKLPILKIINLESRFEIDYEIFIE